MWCGVVWCDMVYCVMLWCGLWLGYGWGVSVWYGVVLYDVMWCSVLCYVMVWFVMLILWCWYMLLIRFGVISEEWIMMTIRKIISDWDIGLWWRWRKESNGCGDYQKDNKLLRNRVVMEDERNKNDYQKDKKWLRNWMDCSDYQKDNERL